jgi:hypothetical protein
LFEIFDGEPVMPLTRAALWLRALIGLLLRLLED